MGSKRISLLCDIISLQGFRNGCTRSAKVFLSDVSIAPRVSGSEGPYHKGSNRRFETLLWEKTCGLEVKHKNLAKSRASPYWCPKTVQNKTKLLCWRTSILASHHSMKCCQDKVWLSSCNRFVHMQGALVCAITTETGQKRGDGDANKERGACENMRQTITPHATTGRLATSVWAEKWVVIHKVAHYTPADDNDVATITHMNLREVGIQIICHNVGPQYCTNTLDSNA